MASIYSNKQGKDFFINNESSREGSKKDVEDPSQVYFNISQEQTVIADPEFYQYD